MPELLTFAVPFVFVFAVTFGLLENINLFGRKPNTLIAVAFGLFAIAYEPFLLFLQSILPIAIVGMTILFFLLALKKTLVDKDKNDIDYAPIIVVLVILLVLAGIFWSDISTALGLTSMAGETLLYAIGAIVIATLFYMAYKLGGKPGTAAPGTPF
jgi:hypothetical protein